MVRRLLHHLETQKSFQAHRIGTSPCDPTFRVDSLKIADHCHPEINTGSDTRPADRGTLIEPHAFLLRKSIEPFALENFVHRIIKDVTASSRQFIRRDPHRTLSILRPSHRHRFSPYAIHS